MKSTIQKLLEELQTALNDGDLIIEHGTAIFRQPAEGDKGWGPFGWTCSNLRRKIRTTQAAIGTTEADNQKMKARLETALTACHPCPLKTCTKEELVEATTELDKARVIYDLANGERVNELARLRTLVHRQIWLVDSYDHPDSRAGTYARVTLEIAMARIEGAEA